MDFLLFYIGAWGMWLAMAGAGIWLAWLVAARTRFLAFRVLIYSFTLAFFFVPGVLAGGHFGSYIPVGVVLLFGIAHLSWATAWGGVWPLALALPLLWMCGYLLGRYLRAGRVPPNTPTPVNAPTASRFQLERPYRRVPE